MKITVLCSCQGSYEVEVEPLDGHMPHAVQCPQCGADGTEFADAVMQNELAEKSAPAAVAPKLVGGRFCKKHEGEPFASECFLCKRPICLQCMAQFGYFCSLTCHRKAQDRRLDIPVYELQESVVQDRTWRRVKLGGTIGTLLVIAWISVWGWYRFYGSRPVVKFSVAISEKERLSHCRFVDRDRVLTMSSKKLTLYSISKGREIWTRDLAPYQKAPVQEADEGGEEKSESDEKGKVPDKYRRLWDDAWAPPAHLHVTPTDAWVVFTAQAVRFDLQTGSEKGKCPIAGAIRSVTAGEQDLEVIATNPAGQDVLTQISMATGEAQTEANDPLPPQPRRPSASVSMADMMAGASIPDEPWVPPEQRELVPTGKNMAYLDIHLVQMNFVAHEAMKEKKESTLEGGKMGVLDTIKVAEELANDSKRSAGRSTLRVDESTYEVTLRRVFAGDPNEWKAEVTGPARLYPQKTVDVLVAGKSIHVFDKSNNHRWEANLTFPIAPAYSFDDGETPAGPCVERGSTLYFFDQGVLTAFEKVNGHVRWRLTSVGISKIQFDAKGMLYINTTSADPETIKYSEQVDFAHMGKPVCMKVDAATGKILWKLEKSGDHCILSGRFVYMTTAQVSQWEVMGSILNGGGMRAPTHFRLHRLDPKNGEEMWEFHITREPEKVDILENQILFQFPNEIQVLRFFAL